MKGPRNAPGTRRSARAPSPPISAPPAAGRVEDAAARQRAQHELAVQTAVGRERERLTAERELEREALAHSLLELHGRAEDPGEARAFALAAVLVFDGEQDAEALADAGNPDRREEIAARVAAARHALGDA